MADPAGINPAETPTPVEHATREPAWERPATGKALLAALEAEGIIGLWCDRPESTDSSDYAGRLRAAAESRR